MALLSSPFGCILKRPSPALWVCMEKRPFACSYRDVITKFLGLIDYQFPLPMVLRWRASRAEAPRSNKHWKLIARTENKSWRSRGRLSCSFAYPYWAKPPPSPLPCFRSLDIRALFDCLYDVWQRLVCLFSSLSSMSIAASSKTFNVSQERKCLSYRNWSG